MILVWSRRAIKRVRTHEGVVGSRKRQWTTDFNQNFGTYIVYNSHVTCSNSSFSLVMVMPTSHFFVFHWLQFTSMCCLFSIGNLPKPTSLGRRICYHSPSSTTSIDEAVNNIHRYNNNNNNTCRVWRHSSNHSDFITVSVNNIRHVQHLQVTLIYYREFVSHWVPYSFVLVSRVSKELSKLLYWERERKRERERDRERERYIYIYIYIYIYFTKRLR